jgi:hypothetical protein
MSFEGTIEGTDSTGGRPLFEGRIESHSLRMTAIAAALMLQSCKDAAILQ